MKRHTKATGSAYTTLHQVVQCIPPWLIQRTANEVGADTRGFSAASHVVALLYGQLSHAFSLNEVCDALGVREASLSRVRGVTAPRRNTLSNANRTRDPEIARRLYWAVQESLRAREPSFAAPGRRKGFLHRFRRGIHAIDSSVLQLSLLCMDWARHRRRKAAAKLHVRLDTGSFIPSFVVVERASRHDISQARALCAGVRRGDIVVADKAYGDFAFLRGLDEAGVSFVLRAREGMAFRAVGEARPPEGDLLGDAAVELANKATRAKYPGTLRRVTMRVEVDGKKRAMTFLTNRTDWSARTVAELYRARWQVELLFKELKQTLQLSDFVGTNENAVRWQVWVALLAHLLLRFLRHRSRWGLSFSRLVGIVRSALWMRGDIVALLAHYGTAGPPRRPVPVYEQLYLQGFEPNTSKPVGQHAGKNRRPR